MRGGEFRGEAGGFIVARAEAFAEGGLTAVGEKPDDQGSYDRGAEGDEQGVHEQDILRARRAWQLRDETCDLSSLSLFFLFIPPAKVSSAGKRKEKYKVEGGRMNVT